VPYRLTNLHVTRYFWTHKYFDSEVTAYTCSNRGILCGIYSLIN
jgi:hypothetical protein